VALAALLALGGCAAAAAPEASSGSTTPSSSTSTSSSTSASASPSASASSPGSASATVTVPVSGTIAQLPLTTPHSVVALGDSVPAGTNCSCDPFPQQYGALLTKKYGTRVNVNNLSVAGQDTAGLIAQLSSTTTQAAVSKADVIVLTIGANDLGGKHDQVENGQCGSNDSDCVSDELETMSTNLTSILKTIATLRAGQPTAVLVTGYWNVFEDGDVAQSAYGNVGLKASLNLTRQVNAAIKSVATSQGAQYVDLYTPFEGSAAITSLLASDGDHPNNAGHALIARTLLAAGLPAFG
jgi:lysophospholipase L1-like esterase